MLISVFVLVQVCIIVLVWEHIFVFMILGLETRNHIRISTGDSIDNDYYLHS